MEKALIYNVTDKVLLLSHKKFRNKNFEIIRNAQLNNNYALDFLNKHIKERTKKIFCSNENSDSIEFYDSSDHNRTMVLPFIKNINPKINKFLKTHNFSLIHNINNKPIRISSN